MKPQPIRSGNQALPGDADRWDWAGGSRLRVREIDDGEGQRLLRILRKRTGSVMTWRRAQMVLLSAQGITT